MLNIEELKTKLAELLPLERFEHSLRVEKSALELAELYNVSTAKTSIAALLHDCSRFLSREQMLKKAKSWGLKISPIEKFEPKLLHAKLSAIIANRSFKIKDKAILTAIKRHTVGAQKMSLLDKIIYLADHIEEQRDYCGVNKVKKLAHKDLNAAIAASTSSMISDLLRNDLPIFEETVKTRNAHLLGKND